MEDLLSLYCFKFFAYVLHPNGLTLFKAARGSEYSLNMICRQRFTEFWTYDVKSNAMYGNFRRVHANLHFIFLSLFAFVEYFSNSSADCVIPVQFLGQFKKQAPFIIKRRDCVCRRYFCCQTRLRKWSLKIAGNAFIWIDDKKWISKR